MHKRVKTSIKYIAINMITILFGIGLNYYLPKILSIKEYGDYRLFLLVLPMFSLLHFGIIDGMYLSLRNENINNYDSISFLSSGFYTLLIVRLITSLIACCILLLLNIEFIVKEILFAAVICSFISNLVAYFDYAFQACGMFDKSGKIKAGTKIVLMFLLVIIMCFKKLDLNCLLTINILSYIIILAKCFRELNLFKVSNKEQHFSLIYEKWIWQNGFFLMLSNVVISSVLAVDKFFVRNIYNEKIFANYSFAGAIILIIIQLANTISSLGFTYMDESNLNNTLYLNKAERTLIFTIAFSLNFLYLNQFIIGKYLINYEQSSVYLNNLIITVFLTTIIQIIYANVFKRKQGMRAYFVVNMLILGFGCVLYYVTNCYFNDIFIMLGSVNIVCIVWYLAIIVLLRKKFNISCFNITNFLTILSVSALYNFVSYNLTYINIIIFNLLLGICTYVLYIKHKFLLYR